MLLLLREGVYLVDWMWLLVELLLLPPPLLLPREGY